MDWEDDVLGFWFGLRPEQWWNSDAELDREVQQRFLGLWQEQRQTPVHHFTVDPETALAAIILFDQFPRNMFRHHADQFSTDPLALSIAREAVHWSYDEALPPERRQFLYMPFQHSENLRDQQSSLLLFTRLGDAYALGYARKHHDVIERFGRFPHRNAILGRPPRPAEVEAGDVVPW